MVINELPFKWIDLDSKPWFNNKLRSEGEDIIEETRLFIKEFDDLKFQEVKAKTKGC